MMTNNSANGSIIYRPQAMAMGTTTGTITGITFTVIDNYTTDTMEELFLRTASNPPPTMPHSGTRLPAQPPSGPCGQTSQNLMSAPK